MKPLARWTITDVSDIGFEMLRISINKFKKLYPEFDCIVCFNNMNANRLDELNTELHEQKKEAFSYVLRENDRNVKDEATGCGWKLCPPRLRAASYELWIDNDIILCDRIPEIDKWLGSNGGIIAEGLHRCRAYGLFDRMIDRFGHFNAGLFGVPPHFDFADSLRARLPLMNNKPLGGLDEQGLTVSIITQMKTYVMVPLHHIWIAEDGAEFPKEVYHGYHFVGANRKPWHSGWKNFQVAEATRMLL